MPRKKQPRPAPLAATSEEGAFVQALVANPDDRTTRLVFADWLDDRADPRAAWLRDDALWAKFDADAVAWLLAPGANTRLPRAVDAAGPVAVPAVRAWVRQRDTLARWYEARHFLETNRPADLKPVNALAAQLDSDGWYDRWEAAIDLGFHGPAAAAAVRALAAALDKGPPDEFTGTDDEPVRDTIFKTLAELGPAAMSAVPSIAAHVHRSEAAQRALLVLRPDPAVVSAHINCDGDDAARVGVRMVAELSADKVAACARILRERRGDRSEAAAVLLGEMGEDGDDVSTAIPAMIGELERAANNWSDHYLRCCLARSFRQIGEAAKAAAPALRAALPEYDRLDLKIGYFAAARDEIAAALAALDPPG